MKPTNTFYSVILSVLLLVTLSACGGGGSGSDGSSSTPTTTPASSAVVLNGQVADGYLVGARIFLDKNANRLLDGDEPSDISTAEGRFSLDIQAGDGERYPLVAQVIAGETIDEDNGAVIEQGYTLESPAGQSAFISPLTTQVKWQMDKNPNLSMLDAEIAIRAQLGINDNISLFDNYVDNNDHSAVTTNYFERAHKAAQIIAGTMAALRAEIESNLGGPAAEGDETALSLMISDAVLENAPAIARAIQPLPGTTAAHVADVVETIMATLDRSALNQQMIERYAQRFSERHATWDATAPRVVRQLPANNDSASVELLIHVTLDEALDPNSITAHSLQLTGPNGQVAGQVYYDAELLELIFEPESRLLPQERYTVTLAAGLSDQRGNALSQPQQWSFETIFDLLPPEMPQL